MSYHSDMLFHNAYPNDTDQWHFNDAHDDGDFAADNGNEVHTDNDRIPPGDDEYVDNDIFEAHFDMEPEKKK